MDHTVLRSKELIIKKQTTRRRRKLKKAYILLDLEDFLLYFIIYYPKTFEFPLKKPYTFQNEIRRSKQHNFRISHQGKQTFAKIVTNRKSDNK